MFWHPPTALHLPTLQLYITNDYSWIDVFAWTLANCWLACDPGAPKPLAKQWKACLKVSNDVKKEKRPKKYLGFSILLACCSFQRTCEISLQNLGRDRNFSRVHTPCIPDHRIPLQEALEQGQKNHSWTSSSSVLFSWWSVIHQVACCRDATAGVQFSMFEARQAQMWAWKQVRSIKRKWTREKRTMRRNPECTSWPPTYCLASCSPQSHTKIFSNFNNNFMNLRSWCGTLKEHAEISLPHWLEPDGVGCLVRMSPHP